MPSMSEKEVNQENCDSNCASCGVENCPGRKGIEMLKPHEGTSFKKTIAVLSGKGGVGKSLVSTLLASKMASLGKKVAFLDADVTGPSIPRSFGFGGYEATGSQDGIEPALTKNGIRLMSANLLMDDPAAPIIWRGTLVSNLVSQMYSMVEYGECDYLFIDMPPGTGDVPLTVFQQIHIDGAIMVTTPQELVELVVEKAVNMCKMMNIPLLGLVENMSYVECPHCGERIYPFGESKLEEVASHFGIEPLGRLPIKKGLSSLIDQGKADEYEGEELSKSIAAIESL